MVDISNISKPLYSKIIESALIKYNVLTEDELNSVILEKGRQALVNEYLDIAKLRIMRKKADEAKAYSPTYDEIIDKLQGQIDAAKQ